MTTQLGNSSKNRMPSGPEQLPVQNRTINLGDFHEFMEKSKGRNIDAFKSSGVFYLAGMSKVS
jgi:hypothetical protein